MRMPCIESTAGNEATLRTESVAVTLTLGLIFTALLLFTLLLLLEFQFGLPLLGGLERFEGSFLDGLFVLPLFLDRFAHRLEFRLGRSLRFIPVRLRLLRQLPQPALVF